MTREEARAVRRLYLEAPESITGSHSNDAWLMVIEDALDAALGNGWCEPQWRDDQ